MIVCRCNCGHAKQWTCSRCAMKPCTGVLGLTLTHIKLLRKDDKSHLLYHIPVIGHPNFGSTIICGMDTSIQAFMYRIKWQVLNPNLHICKTCIKLAPKKLVKSAVYYIFADWKRQVYGVEKTSMVSK